MSIRSIDMQVIVPRAVEVGKNQHNITQQGAVQQQQLAEQIQKTAEVRQRQVQSLVKNSGGKVERDSGTKDNQQNSRKDGYTRHNLTGSGKDEHHQPAEAVTTAAQNPVLGHIIDIKM